MPFSLVVIHNFLKLFSFSSKFYFFHKWCFLDQEYRYKSRERRHNYNTLKG